MLTERRRRIASSSSSAGVLTTAIMIMLMTTTSMVRSFQFAGSRVMGASRRQQCPAAKKTTSSQLMMMMSSSTSDNKPSSSKGKILVLGGTGFLGQEVCQRALDDGYRVVSLSRRGLPPDTGSAGSAVSSSSNNKVDYRKGDARQAESLLNVLQQDDDDEEFTGIVHCIGLLFDNDSGLGQYNRFVSGSGSLPDLDSTYETITRQTAFNAIDAATQYMAKKKSANRNAKPLPFCFTSAAEAGWPEMTGGTFVEENLAPDFLRRYLVAKRAVEAKLLDADDNTAQQQLLRPIIVRPSLIYSMDRPASYVPVGAFFVGNAIGVPFVDKPVSVQTLARAIVNSLDQEKNGDVRGVLRYDKIEQVAART